MSPLAISYVQEKFVRKVVIVSSALNAQLVAAGHSPILHTYDIWHLTKVFIGPLGIFLHLWYKLFCSKIKLSLPFLTKNITF